MNWYKKAINEIKDYLDSIISAWILPNGQYVNVGTWGHEKYANENPDKFGITKEELKRTVQHSYEMAFSKGGVRLDIVVKVGEVNVCGTKAAIRKNIFAIQDLLIKNHITRVIVEIFDPVVESYTPTIYRSREDFMGNFV